MPWVIILKLKSEYYLKYDHENDGIFSFDSAHNGLEYYQRGWRECQKRDYTWVTSATISYIGQERKIVEVDEDIEDIRDRILGLKQGKTPTLIKITSAASYDVVIKCNGENIAQIFDECPYCPALMTDEEGNPL